MTDCLLGLLAGLGRRIAQGVLIPSVMPARCLGGNGDRLDVCCDISVATRQRCSGSRLQLRGVGGSVLAAGSNVLVEVGKLD